MSALPATITDKLGKLVPRLATDHDGEVVATVRAIGRTLVGAGLDWHDLTKAIVAPPRATRDPTRAKVPETWHELAKWCRDHGGGRLQEKERGFVWDMAARLVCGGEPTERQGAWLRAIYAKLKREASI